MIPSFVERPYNLKLNVALKRKRDKTAFITAQRVFISSRLNYDLLPNSLESSLSLTEFKTNINTWTAENYP